MTFVGCKFGKPLMTLLASFVRQHEAPEAATVIRRGTTNGALSRDGVAGRRQRLRAYF